MYFLNMVLIFVQWVQHIFSWSFIIKHLGYFFILVINQHGPQNFFYNKFYFMPLHVSSILIISRSKLYYAASGIITPIGGCPMHRLRESSLNSFDLLMMSTWCLKHVEAWNKTYCKTKFFASSWLITKINILRCTVSKTSKTVRVVINNVTVEIRNQL